MPVKFPVMAGKPYRPGYDEDVIFMDIWCDNCAHKNCVRENRPCSILEAMQRLYMDHEGYPQELVYDEEGIPKCTAFTQRDL